MTIDDYEAEGNDMVAGMVEDGHGEAEPEGEDYNEIENAKGIDD